MQEAGREGCGEGERVTADRALGVYMICTPGIQIQLLEYLIPRPAARPRPSQKTAKCRYLGNREWYHRSAGVKIIAPLCGSHGLSLKGRYLEVNNFSLTVISNVI